MMLPSLRLRTAPTLLLLNMLIVCWCQYSKIQFHTQYSPITNIQNCRASSNVIFTTQDGKLNHWVAYRNVQEYAIQPSAHHQLECSKYGHNLDHAYVAVLDDHGRVTLWEEVIRIFNVYMGSIPFQPVRKNATPTDISVGNYYLAVGYHAENIIDIYDINDLDKPPLAVQLPTPYKAFKVDIMANLAVVLSLDNTSLSFEYMIMDYSNSKIMTNLSQRITHNINQSITLDYSYSQVGGVQLKYMVTGTNTTSFVYYTQYVQLMLVDGQHMSSNQKLCDGDQSYPHASSVEKYATGTIITVDYTVLDYACTTDTGSYVYSQVYVVSSYGGEYYVDAYYDTNGLIDFAIGISICCCCFCFCLRMCAKAPQMFGQMCILMGKVAKFLFELLCWCPTRSNLEDIEDALES